MLYNKKILLILPMLCWVCTATGQGMRADTALYDSILAEWDSNVLINQTIVDTLAIKVVTDTIYANNAVYLIQTTTRVLITKYEYDAKKKKINDRDGRLKSKKGFA